GGGVRRAPVAGQPAYSPEAVLDLSVRSGCWTQSPLLDRVALVVTSPVAPANPPVPPVIRPLPVNFVPRFVSLTVTAPENVPRSYQTLKLIVARLADTSRNRISVAPSPSPPLITPASKVVPPTVSTLLDRIVADSGCGVAAPAAAAPTRLATMTARTALGCVMCVLPSTL